MYATQQQQQFTLLDDKLRPLSYPGTHVFLLCFAVVSEASYENVESKWVPELKKHCPTTPIILVGTKTDLRGDAKYMQNLKSKNQKVLTLEDGNALAKKISALKYMVRTVLYVFIILKGM